MFRRLAFPLALALLAAACSDDPGPVRPVNRAPVILDCSAEPDTVALDLGSLLSVTAEDPDGDALSATWAADGGFFPDGADGDVVVWRPPAIQASYRAWVEVDDGAETVRDTVTLHVSLPAAEIAPTSLDFGFYETEHGFTITNTGLDALTWSADASAAWLSADPASGVLPAGLEQDVVVSVDRDGLDPGAHAGAVTVSSLHGVAVVNVAMRVPGAPVLAFSPDTLDFGLDLETLPLTVSNLGDLDLTWSIDAGEPWVAAEPAAGVLATGSTELDIIVLRSAIMPGEHHAELQLSSDGGAGTVAVSLRMPVPPLLAVSPLTLTLGADEDTGVIEIANAGDGELDWEIVYTGPALSADPPSGTADEAADLVTITVDRAGLPAGQHTQSVDMESDNGDERIDVSFTVNAGPTTHDNLFFLHHSTGRNLINEGNVRGRLAQIDPDLDFWDHDYNHIGLTDPDGDETGDDYAIPGDNTDPDGLHNLWTTGNSARAEILANHEVIAFKSCYPASDIGSSAELAQYKTWYLEIRDFLDTRPDRVFVIMSPPPRHRLATDADDPARARAFADWLGSAEYLDGHPNLVYFDLFDELANDDDVLKYEYERSHSSDDSHPNATANAAVGPRFADALAAAAGSVRR